MIRNPGTKDPGGWEGKKQVWPTHWPRVPVAVQLFHPHSRDAGDQKSSARALHSARCTVRGCTHAVEPVHTSLLHGFPLTANAWPQSALAYCKQPHWPVAWPHVGRFSLAQNGKVAKKNSQSSKQSSCEGCYQIFLFWVNAPWSTMSHMPPLTKFIHLISKYSNWCNEKLLASHIALNCPLQRCSKPGTMDNDRNSDLAHVYM